MEMNPPASSPCELTLECRPSAKRSYTVLKSQIGDETQNLQKYLQALEEERVKIEVFKRELPFSMQLLNDAIEASERLLGDCDKLKCPIKEEQNGPKSVLQEFIPVKKTKCEEPAGKESQKIEMEREAAHARTDIPNWMSSAQLWSHNHETKEINFKQQDSHPQQTFPLNRGGGAFLPFSRERQENPRCPDPGLSSGGEDQEVDCHPISSCNRVVNLKNKNDDDDNGLKETFEEGIPKTDGANSNPNTSPNDCQRKPRRCWSPELHRKFVDALQQLGGSQATPKQIRELMKVDGLTNDEVKSHLQKYRLHTRRLSPSCVSAIPQPQVPPQLVVVGGIWVHPEHAASRGQGLYTALPAIQHGHYYCQPSNSAIGVEDFCCQRSNASVYEMQEERQGSPQSWGMADYAKSKSFDMNEELQDCGRGNGELTRKFDMGLSLHRCAQEDEDDGKDGKPRQTALNY